MHPSDVDSDASESIRNREDWLWRLLLAFRPMFSRCGTPLPGRVRVTCGFPSRNALGSRTRVIGQCWAPSQSADGHYEILVSPTLDNATVVAATLLHECVHAAVGIQAGHRGPFRRVALDLGLVGPMTATTAGPALQERLNALTDQLGAYPHAALCPSRIGSHTPPKQSTRLIKIECVGCGYVARTTRTWISTGLPICHCGGHFVPSS